MPLVLRRIAEVLGQTPLTHLNPDTCVAHGAALVARGEGRFDGAVLLDVLSVPIGLVFPGGRTEFIFDAGCNLPAQISIPVPRPTRTPDLAVGVWQGPSLTSSERNVLGILHLAPHLFEGSDPLRLELSLSEDLKIGAAFVSGGRREPLRLERTPQRRSI